MKKIVSVILCCMCFSYSSAQVTLSTDFTSENLEEAPLHNIWSVANRISPRNGVNVRTDLKVNLVRMIGGVNKKGKGRNVPDLDFDPCHYDSITNTYVYNWEPLISRIDQIVNTQVGIHQIVLDQPPWAFQHGYTFIPTGTSDSIHFREDERITKYGNSLPPYDKEAYFNFIAALMTKLIDTYGEEQILSWRFRVGSEIETPDHWRGTEQDFIDHFANTEKAIRLVLPGAKVGLHTRPPDFLYKKGEIKNYKGEVISSFVEGLIDYCYDNHVRYDFWGISDYVRITNTDSRAMSKKYEELFAPLVNHPKWNKNTTLDLMEYSTITIMHASGVSFITCASSHKEIVELVFANQFYRNVDKGLEYIYRWGNGPGTSDPVNVEMVNSMLGKIRYETQISGIPTVADNELDAVFSKNEEGDEYDVLIYNYNASSLDYSAEEPVALSFTTDLPVGTILQYRYLSYGKVNNKLQTFLENAPASGWVTDGYDRNGASDKILNKAGAAAWKTYTNPNPSAFGSWKSIVTQLRTDGGEGSIINVDTDIASFAFKKFEFKK